MVVGKSLLGLRLGIDAEVVNFDRDVGITGWRVNAAPQTRASDFPTGLVYYAGG